MKPKYKVKTYYTDETNLESDFYNEDIAKRVVRDNLTYTVVDYIQLFKNGKLIGTYRRT